MTIWTVKEVAEFLKVNVVTVYKLIREDGLPAFRVGSEWRFVRESVEEWVRRKEALMMSGGKVRKVKIVTARRV